MNEQVTLNSKEWLELIWEAGRATHPELMKQLYPRRIQPPTGYFNPRHYSTMLYGLIRFWQMPEADMFPHTTGALSALHMMHYGVPTYFVKDDYAQAVAQTNPPADFRLSEIQWPLDAMLFVLPDHFAWNYFGWYIPFVSVCRVKAGEYPKDLKTKLPKDLVWSVRIGNEKDRILIHFPLFIASKPAIDYTGAYPLTDPISIIDEAQWADASYYDCASVGVNPLTALPNDAPQGEAEQLVQKKVNHFAIRLLLALTAEPGYMQAGSISRTEKRDRKGQISREALWSPNLLGWDYRVARPAAEYQGGTHATPRMHWRRGHYTYAAKGQRDQLVSVRGLPRNAEGKVDWSQVSQPVVEAFWKTHTLRWIKPVLVA